MLARLTPHSPAPWDRLLPSQPRGCGGIWQTRTVQVRVGVSPWRFKSSHPHKRLHLGKRRLERSAGVRYCQTPGRHDPDGNGLELDVWGNGSRLIGLGSLQPGNCRQSGRLPRARSSSFRSMTLATRRTRPRSVSLKRTRNSPTRSLRHGRLPTSVFTSNASDPGSAPSCSSASMTRTAAFFGSESRSLTALRERRTSATAAQTARRRRYDRRVVVLPARRSDSASRSEATISGACART